MRRFLLILGVLFLSACLRRPDSTDVVVVEGETLTPTTTPTPSVATWLTVTPYPTPSPYPTVTPYVWTPPPTPTPPPTAAVAVTVPTFTPAPDEFQAVAGCPNSVIPSLVKDFEGKTPGYEQGYLPEGNYPATINSPTMALMIPDGAMPRIWDQIEHNPAHPYAGMWTVPGYSTIKVCTQRACLELQVLTIGPTFRQVDLASMQRPAELALSRAAWETLFGIGAADGPYPANIEVLYCAN